MLIALSVGFSSSAFSQKKPFSSVNELAIVSTGGNSNMETYNAKTENKYKENKRTYGISGHYTLGLSDQGEESESDDLVESARNWDARGSYEQELTNNISAVAALQYEGDVFSGYLQRENHDIGGKYNFIDTDKKTLYLEVGYRYTEERRTEEDEDGRSLFFFNKGVVTAELQRKQETFTYGLWLQYVPNFTESEDYQINVEPTFTVIINDLFSMKVSYKGNYDNEPNVEGNERLDWKYTTALVARY